jgi:hypothetical protein
VETSYSGTLDFVAYPLSRLDVDELIVRAESIGFSMTSRWDGHAYHVDATAHAKGGDEYHTAPIGARYMGIHATVVIHFLRVAPSQDFCEVEGIWEGRTPTRGTHLLAYWCRSQRLARRKDERGTFIRQRFQPPLDPLQSVAASAKEVVNALLLREPLRRP